VNWQSLQQHDADVNGVRIRYRQGGAGRPLVLLHGFPQTALAWRKLIPLLPEDRMIVAPDLRGYGDSERPGTGYDIQTMVNDVRKLLEHLELGTVDIVGHDLGGIVAYA
jgi:pimeloyl-ACP methyl ester carboxylesterase